MTRIIFYRISKIVSLSYPRNRDGSRRDGVEKARIEQTKTVVLTVRNDMIPHFLGISANRVITAMSIDRLLQNVRATIEKRQD